MDWQRQWQRLRRPSVWLAAGMVAFVATGAAVGLGHGGTKTGTLRTATGSSGLGLPAVPAAPVSTLPLATIAPPMPRPSLNSTKFSTPAAAPHIISASAAQLLSLSAKIGF